MAKGFKDDAAHGFHGRSSGAMSHVVSGAPGFRSGGSKMGSNDPAAGFHGRSAKAMGHKAAGPKGGPKRPSKKL